jgi:hypothetical protein
LVSSIFIALKTLKLSPSASVAFLKYRYRLILSTAVVLSLFCGCLSSNQTPINKHYEERTVLFDLGDRSAKTALWGHPETGSWGKIWPSLPLCNSGPPWIERDADLIFIGWDKEDPLARVVLVTFDAGSATDLSAKIISSAANAGLIGEHWTGGFDFTFDGLKQ